MSRFNVGAGISGAIAIATAAAALSLPSTAGAVVLFDQTDHAAAPSADSHGAAFAPSNEFTPTEADRTADDFVVPAGETWTVDTIEATGAYQDSSSPTPAVNAYIYPNASGKPGFALFSQLGIPATGGPDYTVHLTGAPTLGAGTYWVTVQQADASNGYWSWGTRTVLSNSPAQWNGNAGVPGCNTAGWNPRAACWPSLNPDQTFRLSGSGTNLGPPDTTITQRPDDRTDKPTARYKFKSSEAESTFECKLKGNGLPHKARTFRACTSPRRYRHLDPGRYRFQVRAIDVGGNVDPTPAKDKFRVLG